MNDHLNVKSNAAFSRAAFLQRHMGIHAGERPFKWEQCNDAFSVNGNLKFHLRTHTGERQFKCEQCKI